MTKREQKRIVRELIDSIGSTILQAIDQGKIPAEWDGIELRQYLSELAARSRATSMLMQKPYSDRRKDYDNTVLVNDL